MSDQITDPSEESVIWLAQSQQHLLDLLTAQYGECHLDGSEKDLELCQRLIDDKRVKAKNILEAQCIGVALGNVWVKTTPMQWKQVKNEFGSMLALHNPGTKMVLYPLTMVSKRLAHHQEIDLISLYTQFAWSNKKPAQ